MIQPSRKAKLAWHCRRGMLELDLILTRFLEAHIDAFSEDDIGVFERLLTYSDPELYAWFMGTAFPDDTELVNLVAIIKRHD